MPSFDASVKYSNALAKSRLSSSFHREFAASTACTLSFGPFAATVTDEGERSGLVVQPVSPKLTYAAMPSANARRMLCGGRSIFTTLSIFCRGSGAGRVTTNVSC